MNYENVTLCKLALASTIYDSLTPFNYSLGLLNSATGGSIDLTNPAHRISLMKWLNDWGCRHLSKDQHEIASHSILNWYQANGATLFPNRKQLWDLEDQELEVTAAAYGSLKDRTGAWRIRGGRKLEVHIGATAASKILFAIRPKALMPWDEAMRTSVVLPIYRYLANSTGSKLFSQMVMAKIILQRLGELTKRWRHYTSFECDGSPTSYFRYLKTIRHLTFQIGILCRNKGFEIDDLPKELGRPNSTVLALVNEYIWITETRKCELPSSHTLARWATWG